ncbi:MAG TPA: hypothetical protein PKN75_07540 [Bacteroidia bacterium]|nr:hypothetical protein [Bacteroidia bacterium]HNU33431.1 hypothetical protein [Bacteroidia bacterium]
MAKQKTESIVNFKNLAGIKQQEIERFKLIDKGLLPHALFKRPVTVKILMLVDSGISFNQFYFGLSEVIDTLNNNPEWWVNFELHKAHRFLDPNKPVLGTPAYDLYGPTYENFRFTQSGFNMNDYDQLWIFGFNSGTAFPASLNTDELEIVYKWMNEKKGGVLAMGDHSILGEALGGKIPRVRNMRKWSVADGVPIQFGEDRHDTLVIGHDNLATPAVDDSNVYTFDDESDDIAMRIRPRWYYSYSLGYPFYPKHWYWPYIWRKSPHPILCGKNGVINILPDHPHEGEVVVPSDLTLKPKFNTYQFDEYPAFGGSSLPPEIIAWAKVQDDHKASDFKGTANSKEFGAIGAYNGHKVDVGRVVVDSTWHHWFDVNLTGRMFFNTDNPGNIASESNDPRKLNGFNDTASGKAALDKIRNYFRNVAIWLSPPDKIKRMACLAFWNSIFKYPLFADFHYHMPVWVIGHHAIDVLGKYAGQCNVKGWWHVFMPEKKLERFFDPKIMPTLTLQNIDAFMVGGILKAMLAHKEDFIAGKFKEPDDKALLKMVNKGIAIGIDAMREFSEEQMSADKNNLESLKQLSTAFK